MIEKLRKLERESIERKIPIIGSEKGQWLSNKIKEIQPKKILELGTANGYSSIILGSQGAEVTTIEIDSQIAEEATKNFHKFETNAFIIIGDGVQITKDLVIKNQQYDLIFIDFYKAGYIKVIEDCIQMTKTGGYIIADNITFEKCQDFKKSILNHPDLETEIIHIKDGLSISKRK